MDREQLLKQLYEEFTGKELDELQRGSIHIVFGAYGRTLVTTTTRSCKEHDVIYTEDELTMTF